MSQLSFADNGPEPLKPWQGGQLVTPHSEPTTSKEAALRVMNKTEAMRESIFLELKLNGELTQEEISTVLGLSGDTVRPRLWELCGNGKHERRIEKTNNKRRTASGAWARTYRVL